MKSIALSLLCFIALNLFGQSNLKPENYSGIPQNIKLVLFNDQFNNNDNLWDIGLVKDQWKEVIKNGMLYFQSLDYLPNEDYLPVLIDEDGDFEIETSLRFVDGDNIQAFGLQWGKLPEDAGQFDFFISGNGQYTIDKFSGEFTDYVPFTSSDLIKRDGFNKLTVRKMDDTYYFFLNETLVHQMPFEPFMGKNVGFQVGKKSAIEVDYLHVSQIMVPETIEPTQLMIMNYDFESSTGKFEKGAPITLNTTFKNTGDILLNQVMIKVSLPLNIKLIGDDKKIINNIKPGDEKDINFQFFASKAFNQPNVAVKLLLDGVNYTNVNDLDIIVPFEKELPKENLETMAKEYSEFRGSGDPLKGLNVAKAYNELEIGDYYALIIGIDDYSNGWEKLKNAVNDAKGVEKLLRDEYRVNHFITLYNEEATRSKVIESFEWLSKNVKEDDNLLIFYSGHGDYNEELNKGFWVPVDASASSVSGYISNDDIKMFLASIKTKHTLLIADACFSGDIFRGKTLTVPYEDNNKYYHKVYNLNSRKAITSGGLEPVMDGGSNGHSVFTYYLLKSLMDNHNRFYDGGQLFSDIKIPVINNSYQTPDFKPVRNTGDEGGQFIFVKKTQ